MRTISSGLAAMLLLVIAASGVLLAADDEDIGSAGVFSPIVAGRELTFEPTPDRLGIRDRETGSTWSVAGVATDGSLAGTELERVVSGDHFWFSWAAFTPETRVWQPPTES